MIPKETILRGAEGITNFEGFAAKDGSDGFTHKERQFPTCHQMLPMR
jgi:hypothetical protein